MKHNEKMANEVVIAISFYLMDVCIPSPSIFFLLGDQRLSPRVEKNEYRYFLSFMETG